MTPKLNAHEHTELLNPGERAMDKEGDELFLFHEFPTTKTPSYTTGALRVETNQPNVRCHRDFPRFIPTWQRTGAIRQWLRLCQWKESFAFPRTTAGEEVEGGASYRLKPL